MKKRLFTIIGFTIFSILILLTVNNYKERIESFNKNLNILYNEQSSMLIQNFLIDYYVRNGEFPEKYEKIDTAFYNALNSNSLTNSDFNYIKERFYTDPFSVDSSFYYYKAIYNEVNGKREGCFLLSAGIDGKINNKISDRIYIHDSISINTYESNQGFNYLTALLGKKDLLLFDINGIANMKMYHAEYNVKEIMDYFQNDTNRHLKYHKMLKKSICVKGVVDSIDNNSFFFKESTFSIAFQLYYPNSTKIELGDNVELLGICNQYIGDTLVLFINSIPCNSN